MTNNFKKLHEAITNPIETNFEKVWNEFDQLKGSLAGNKLKLSINTIGKTGPLAGDQKVIVPLLKKLSTIEKQITKVMKDYEKLYDETETAYKKSQG